MPNLSCTCMLSLMLVAVSDSYIIAVIHSAQVMRFILTLAPRGVSMVIQLLDVHANVCKGRVAMMTAHWGIAHLLASPCCTYWPYWQQIVRGANGGNGSQLPFCGGCARPC
jgi:hypothetical protein